GTILVAARKEEHDTFVKKFGAVPEVGATRPVRNRETTRLTGTLRLTAKKIPYIDLTDGLADEELLSKVVTGGDAEARPDENRRKFKGSSKANRAAR
ncbi:MAG: hypothetical protein GWO24_14675, partial [Akkermansiaceae bacterium]|nr:hypothetical protein [Akkermansiaceae bacterium]